MAAIYDLLVIGAVRADGTLPVTGQLADAAGVTYAVTGVAKLAQRWLREFGSERGTLPYEPTRGTDFLAQLRAGQLRTESDVFQAFALASLDITRGLRSDETADMPAAERSAGATLVGLELAPGRLGLTIQVRSLDGAAVLQLPVSTIN